MNASALANQPATHLIAEETDVPISQKLFTPSKVSKQISKPTETGSKTTFKTANKTHHLKEADTVNQVKIKF